MIYKFHFILLEFDFFLCCSCSPEKGLGNQFFSLFYLLLVLKFVLILVASYIWMVLQDIYIDFSPYAKYGCGEASSQFSTSAGCC